MVLAIVKTGGKQYLVSPGQKIKIEKLDKPAFAKATAGKEEGSEVTFSEVLLLEKGRSIEIGTPLVNGAKVTGKLVSQGKAKKVIIFHYKSKTRRRIKKGHRQPFTEVEVIDIVMGGKQLDKKKGES